MAEGGAVFDPAVLIRLTGILASSRPFWREGMEKEITVVHLGDHTRGVAAKALLL